jgi:hypothetical protein
MHRAPLDILVDVMHIALPALKNDLRNESSLLNDKAIKTSAWWLYKN